MADIAFSDKAGSSNFTAGGDKRNQIFSDLLLNRAELETYLTSLRRQQYSATPPANPNTGDMWRCSTTGGSYTAGVLYRYSGTAWAQEIATALNVPNRNTVLQGSVSASGVPTLFEAGTGLACKLNATTVPCIFAFMNGNSAVTGSLDIIDGIATDNATFWSSLPTSSTVYLYVDRSAGGALTGGYTTVAPVTQTFAPAHSAGLQWVDFNTGKVQSSDGSAWTQRNRVFVGTATTNGGAVTAVSVLGYNAIQTLPFGSVTATTVQDAIKQLDNRIPHNRTVYATAGTFIFTALINGLHDVTVVGGGGGGGGAIINSGSAYAAAGGGAGGGYAKKRISLTAGTSVTVTVGAGGAGQGASTNGSNGGTSSFGSYCSATGGGGGNASPSSSSITGFGIGGNGGVGGGGDINGKGSVGGSGHGESAATATVGVGGAGGDSLLSGGAVWNTTGASSSGVLGSGGNGALVGTSGYAVGGGGGSGAVIIEW